VFDAVDAAGGGLVVLYAGSPCVPNSFSDRGGDTLNDTRYTFPLACRILVACAA